MSYYEREAATHLDGSPIFKSALDEQNEASTAEILRAAWGCDLHSFGRLSVIDWYAERDGRLVGLVELKSRSHPSSRFETVYLNVRKWLALTMAELGLGVPAIFAVHFTDGVWWTPLSMVEPARVGIGGCLRVVKSRSDVEPVIEVPVAQMRRVA